MECSEAINNAVRILEAAETETNLQLMDALIRLGEAWTALAVLIDTTA